MYRATCYNDMNVLEKISITIVLPFRMQSRECDAGYSRKNSVQSTMEQFSCTLEAQARHLPNLLINVR